MDRTDQTFRLQSGRKIGYAEYGPEHGTPVIHCHGSNSSRLEHPPASVDLDALGVRFIVLDRPGHGLSTFKAEFSPLDCARDIRKLAEHLELRQFILTGWSMGGAHALACAHQIPERVAAVGLAACVAPMDRPDAMDGVSRGAGWALTLADKVPWLVRMGMAIHGGAVRRNPRRVVERAAKRLADADREVLANPECLDVLLPAMQEAFRQGSRGPAWEGVRMVRSWGFAIQDVRVPVHLWHGDEDRNVPQPAAEYLASAIPDAEAAILPGAGHFFVLERWGEILTALLDVARSQATR